MNDLDLYLLIGSVTVLLAVLAARLGSRVGLPALLLFLGLGMLLGEDVGRIPFNDPELAHTLGFGALVLILAEGGLTTRWRDIRPSIGPAVVLATVGVGVSIAAMTLFGTYVLRLDVSTAVLLGAVCSPTDAAAVFAVLRRVPIPARLRGTLEAESGLNDAPTVLIVTVASSAAAYGTVEGGPLLLTAMVIGELVAGLAIGAVLGVLGGWLLRRVALPSSGLYPLATLGWAVLAYALAATLHTSGFAAVYVCAVLLGNASLPHRGATRSFVEGVGWIAQIGLFVMLGLLATPHTLKWYEAGYAVAAGLFLTLVARPLSVIVCALPFRTRLRHQAFLSWAGLRGAVPIVLTTIPLAVGVPTAHQLFNVVLVFVLVFTCLQAPTLPIVARLLGLTDPAAASQVEVEVAPLDKISADLVQVRVPVGSQLHGVEVRELRLPADTVVSLIIRNDTPRTPNGRDRIKVGDELLIVTPSVHREETEDRLRLLGRGGRLARWHTRGRSGPGADPDW